MGLLGAANRSRAAPLAKGAACVVKERDVATELRWRSPSRGGGPSRPESSEVTARERELEPDGDGLCCGFVVPVAT